jgi:hypothetical protein
MIHVTRLPSVHDYICGDLPENEKPNFRIVMKRFESLLVARVHEHNSLTAKKKYDRSFQFCRGRIEKGQL